MNKTEMDLDINNYELDDILNLFQLQANFNEADLKRAKQMGFKAASRQIKIVIRLFLVLLQSLQDFVFSLWI